MVANGSPRHPTASERKRRREEDPGYESDMVAMTPQGAANSGYAYHDVSDTGIPVCGAGGPDSQFVRVTRELAKRRHKSPCQGVSASPPNMKVLSDLAFKI